MKVDEGMAGEPREQVQQREIAELAPWFHNLHLPSGVQTLPDHWLGGDFPTFKWQRVAPLLPASLDGWRVLDIGCNAGFYSIELARRGASVLAIDNDPHYLRQARWAVREFGLADRIELRELQVYELAGVEETFDLVWFMGVFYHLRYPLLALDIVAQKVRRLLVFQTLMMPGAEVLETQPDYAFADRHVLAERGWPKLAFIEHSFARDPTNWFVPNHAAVLAMLRSAGFRVTALPGQEIYVCEPDRADVAAQRRWESEEFAAATGRSRHPRLDAGAA